MIVAGVLGVPGLQLQVYPLEFPPLPLLPAAGILIGLLPALVAPMDRSASGTRTTAPPPRADEGQAPGAPAPAPATPAPAPARPDAAQPPAPVALRVPFEPGEGTVA
jgi:energy-coupling factor transport system permease protein